MKKVKITSTISNKLGKTGLKLKKHSPQILLIFGVAGLAGSTILACRATTKINKPIEEIKTASEEYHKRFEGVENKAVKREGQRDLATKYIHAGTDLIKLYTPAVLLGASSLTCILTSHRILSDRYAAASAACTSAMAGFTEYRAKVRERFGEEVDKELRYNINPKTVETTVIDENTGKEKKSKTKTKIADVGELGPFTKIYDETCKFWNSNMDYNLSRLRMEEEYVNHTLKTRGYMSVNDVYERIGFEPIPEGQIYGWVYDKPGDYISFGIDEINREKVQDFADGYVTSLALDFNVQGNILDKI